jgi:hypothetical protein
MQVESLQDPEGEAARISPWPNRQLTPADIRTYFDAPESMPMYEGRFERAPPQIEVPKTAAFPGGDECVRT